MVKYVTGDILSSDADVILHQVNCKGKMNAGIDLRIKNTYPAVYERYFDFCDTGKADAPSSRLLGNVLITPISPSQSIASLFAQDGYAFYGFATQRYTDYDKLRECLKVIAEKYDGKRIALPYHLGCGISGGNWDIVIKIIEEELEKCEVEIFSPEQE